MLEEIFLTLGSLTALTVWLALKHVLAARRIAKQLLIVQVGATCTGKVVAIQRPFMLDDCTRLYFDFVPTGMSEPVRVCHIARLEPPGPNRPLPATGSTVTIRYLPDRPHQAVIGGLVIP
jgi:hypothetical protein